MGVCGFPKRLKLHLQRNTHRTERLRLRDFLKARVGLEPVDEGPEPGTGQGGIERCSFHSREAKCTDWHCPEWTLVL